MGGERRVEGQLVTEGLLLAAVGEPVVHSDFGDQVGAQTSKLGGRHPPLETLRPEKGSALTDTRLRVLEKHVLTSQNDQK